MHPWATFQLVRERQRRLLEEAARLRLLRAARRRRRLHRVQIIDLSDPGLGSDLSAGGFLAAPEACFPKADVVWAEGG